MPEALTGASAVDYGASIELPDKEPVVEGYEFLGWYSAASGGDPFNFGVDTIKASTTLYAHWSAPKTDVAVIFNIHDASGSRVVAGTSPANISVIYNSKAYEPMLVPVRVGYQFNGWFDTALKADAAVSASIASFDFDSRIASTVTLYASWKPQIALVPFSFNANSTDVVDGTMPSDLAVSYNDTVPAASQIPVRVGFTFGGWYTDDSLTTAFVFAGNPNPARLIAPTEVFAKWLPRSALSINFEPNNAFVLSASMPSYTSLAYGELLRADTAVPLAPGYNFAGWYTDREAGVQYLPGVTRVFTTLTLYARWGA